MSTEILPAEQDPPNGDLPAVIDHAPPPATVFGTDDPMVVMRRTSEVAQGLKEFIQQQGLSKRIGNSDHIQVEGWQMLGMMLGCTAVVTSTARVDHDGAGWEAVAELRDRTGRVIGAGEGECLKSETRWRSADDYAVRSMAQTRAIGKAFRSVFGFIAKAAGYAPAPAEEMPADTPAAETPAEAPAAPRKLKLTKRQRAQFDDALAAYLQAGLDENKINLQITKLGAAVSRDVTWLNLGDHLSREEGKALYEWLTNAVADHAAAEAKS